MLAKMGKYIFMWKFNENLKNLHVKYHFSASERALSNGEIADSKEGLLNAAIDALGAYNRSVGQRSGVVLAPTSGGLKMLPLYILGLLKHVRMTKKSLKNYILIYANFVCVRDEICPENFRFFTPRGPR